jgi:hypothetical protein
VNRKAAKRRYVICIQAPDADDLVVRKVYEVQTDPSSEAHGYLRVADESGEDYLYPKDWFVPVEVSDQDEQALQATSPANAKAL